MTPTFRDYGVTIDPGRRGEVRAHCPQCDPDRRRRKNLAVNVDKGCWECHRCGWRGGLRTAEVIRPVQFDPMATRRQQRQQRKDRNRARAIWRHATPLAESDTALAYLDHRGLGELAADPPADIRAHPALRYYDEGRHIGTFPALVSLIRDPAGKPVGLHRTYLAPDGRGKAPVPSPKKMTPAIRANGYRGAAIRLYPATESLVIAEGIETALALRLALARPVWACISAHGLAGVEIPASVRSVLVAGDHDANRVGQYHADIAARRLAHEGRAVRMMIPDAPGDWLDVLTRQEATG